LARKKHVGLVTFGGNYYLCATVTAGQTGQVDSGNSPGEQEAFSAAEEAKSVEC